MASTDLSVSGAYTIVAERYLDERGFFSELYNGTKNNARNWKQISLSQSKPFVLRGIHVSQYGKLVTCLQGSMQDFVVDLRPSSPTYLLWNRVNLISDEGTQVYIPSGCGHAFVSGENGCTVMYCQEGVFDPSTEMDVAWNDPLLNIRWSIPHGVEPIISAKDLRAPQLASRRSDLAHMPPRKRVLVLGASGQVGSALSKRFTKSSYLCVGTYNTFKGDRTQIFCDFEKVAEDEEIAARLIEQVHPDVVCICSAFTWVDGCEDNVSKAFAVNATAPGIFAKAASKFGIKVVFFSTDYVFDGKCGPYTESNMAAPINVYGASKLEGENKVTAAAPNALVIRTTGVYGPDMQQKNFVCQLIKNCTSGTSMKVPRDQIGSPTYTEDLAEATVQLVAADYSGIINVVGPKICDRYTFAVEVAKVLNLDTSNVLSSSTADLRPRAPRPLSAGLKIDTLANALPSLSMRAVSEAILDWGPLEGQDSGRGSKVEAP
jgi:dTDP-4-dehydrorhamnose reductase/dTDP-4-dehydrorhamnose 3,5-epimerase